MGFFLFLFFFYSDVKIPSLQFSFSVAVFVYLVRLAQGAHVLANYANRVIKVQYCCYCHSEINSAFKNISVQSVYMYVIQGSVAWTLVSIPRWSWVQTAKLAAKLKGFTVKRKLGLYHVNRWCHSFHSNIMNNPHYITDMVFWDIQICSKIL